MKSDKEWAERMKHGFVPRITIRQIQADALRHAASEASNWDNRPGFQNAIESLAQQLDASPVDQRKG